MPKNINEHNHYLFSLIQPVGPSGIPFVELHVGINTATGKPYQQEFFCTSPSIPPAPTPSAPKPISFEELHKLALCEIEENKSDIKKMENENRAVPATRLKKYIQKLEKIIATNESEWKDLLNL